MEPEEIELYRSIIKPGIRLWEWGGGGSTIMAAKAGAIITTVEHNSNWAALLTNECVRQNLKEVSILNIPAIGTWTGDGDQRQFEAYVGAYTGQPLDVVLVDGRARVACMQRISLLGPSGVTVALHDCDRPEYAQAWELFAEKTRVNRLVIFSRREL